jgi:hypothetical protein
MRKTLLAGAAAIGFAFTANGALASASSCNNLCDTDRVLAQALGVNIGAAYSLNLIAQDATAAMTGSVQGNQGVTQGNQNAGAGALQQNAVALAAVEGCGPDCVDVNLAQTAALSVNFGYVHSLNELCGCDAAQAGMIGSINGNVGLTQVSQNAGAGALQQNAIALGSIRRGN